MLHSIPLPSIYLHHHHHRRRRHRRRRFRPLYRKYLKRCISGTFEWNELHPMWYLKAERSANRKHLHYHVLCLCSTQLCPDFAISVVDFFHFLVLIFALYSAALCVLSTILSISDGGFSFFNDCYGFTHSIPVCEWMHAICQNNANSGQHDWWMYLVSITSFLVLSQARVQ